MNQFLTSFEGQLKQGTAAVWAILFSWDDGVEHRSHIRFFHRLAFKWVILRNQLWLLILILLLLFILDWFNSDLLLPRLWLDGKLLRLRTCLLQISGSIFYHCRLPPLLLNNAVVGSLVAVVLVFNDFLIVDWLLNKIILITVCFIFDLVTRLHLLRLHAFIGVLI